jgi:hypothetical protein
MRISISLKGEREARQRVKERVHILDWVMVNICYGARKRKREKR